ncbi:putative ribosomal protein L2, domain 2 [Helianthus debilis subsp. tardiflorus]
MVVEVSTSMTGKHGHGKCHFVAIDILNGKKLEDIVPHVSRTDYQLIDISEDGFVSLLTENGNTKDDLKLATDDALLTQIIVFRNIFRYHPLGRCHNHSFMMDGYWPRVWRGHMTFKRFL